MNGTKISYGGSRNISKYIDKNKTHMSGIFKGSFEMMGWPLDQQRGVFVGKCEWGNHNEVFKKILFNHLQ